MNTQTYAIDIGWQSLKSITGITDMAVTKVEEIDFKNHNLFLHKKKYYIVGEKEDANTIRPENDTKFFKKFLPHIIIMDMQKAGINFLKPISITTSISFNSQVGGNPNLLKIIKNLTYEGNKLDIRVSFVPLGLDILMDVYAEKIHESGQVVVIDIGTKLFKYGVFKNGISLNSETYEEEIGTNLIFSRFRFRLQYFFNDITITEREILESFTSGFLIIKGRDHDVSYIKKQVESEYIAFIAHKLKSRHRRTFCFAKKIIIGGAGVGTVTPEKLLEHDHVMFRNVKTPEEPVEFANYRGLKMLERLRIH